VSHLGDYGYARYFSKRERKTLRAQAVKEFLRRGFSLERAREKARRKW